jgi:plasmid stabilization system protein ParE
MVRQVVWNKKAIIKFEQIITYLSEEVSEKAATKFVQKVDDVIEKLNKYPEIGRRTKNKETVRQYKIDKYKKIYYRKYGQKLLIIYFFDERQNPKSNPYK